MQRSLTQCQMIPNRIILRNNNYAQRKMLINKKFQWLNKYLSAPSPKMINPNKFVASSKIIYQLKKNKNQLSRSRLKTSQQSSISNQCILLPRSYNYSDLRKTASGKFQSKEPTKNIFQQNSFGKFYRKKTSKSQFCRVGSHSVDKKQNLRMQKTVQDSQIKPWNSQNINDDDETLYFRQKGHRIRG